VGIKRVGKKKKKLGTLRGQASGGSGVEISTRRPKFVPKIPPCKLGCPQGTKIRHALTRIALGQKYEKSPEEFMTEAFYVWTEMNPMPSTLGRVCPHPCEGECNRKDLDKAVGINAMERFIGDWGLERELPLKKVSDETRTERIAVVGAGPAGLGCAYHLAKRGYPVTIFEAFPKAGGMLRYGIPAYRLPRDVLDAEIRRILDLGVELECDTAIGRDMPLEDLRKEYRAVFVGIGAHKGRLLRCPGEDAEGVYTGTEFLHRMNCGEKIEVGNRVLVVGGGDTAVDAARVSRRMGAEVTIVYRRTRVEMPAIEPEIVGAEEEGVEIKLLAAPIEILTKDGRVSGMRCQVMELGEPDSSGRRRPVPVEGEEFSLEADTVVAAISQEPDFEGLESLREGKDWVKVDDRGATKEEEVFAGGDVLDLGIVTLALAQGRLAADTIHARITGQQPPEENGRPVIRSDKMVFTFYQQQKEQIDRQERVEIPVAERFADPDAEVQRGLSEEEAFRESKRCMSCGQCFDCGTCWSFCQDGAIVKPLTFEETYKFKMELCKGCDKCAEQCPCGFIEMYDPAVG
jgi:NADPH-dependent glutamate synthase beta subunit-like oxidoreductase